MVVPVQIETLDFGDKVSVETHADHAFLTFSKDDSAALIKPLLRTLYEAQLIQLPVGKKWQEKHWTRLADQIRRDVMSGNILEIGEPYNFAMHVFMGKVYLKVLTPPQVAQEKAAAPVVAQAPADASPPSAQKADRKGEANTVQATPAAQIETAQAQRDGVLGHAAVTQPKLPAAAAKPAVSQDALMQAYLESWAEPLKKDKQIDSYFMISTGVEHRRSYSYRLLVKPKGLDILVEQLFKEKVKSIDPLAHMKRTLLKRAFFDRTHAFAMVTDTRPQVFLDTLRAQDPEWFDGPLTQAARAIDAKQISR